MGAILFWFIFTGVTLSRKRAFLVGNSNVWFQYTNHFRGKDENFWVTMKTGHSIQTNTSRPQTGKVMPCNKNYTTSIIKWKYYHKRFSIIDILDMYFLLLTSFELITELEMKYPYAVLI